MNEEILAKITLSLASSIERRACEVGAAKVSGVATSGGCISVLMKGERESGGTVQKRKLW